MLVMSELDKLIRRVSAWLTGLSAILAGSLALVLWWGGGSEGHIRRLIYSPGDHLFVMELMRISELKQSERRELGQKLAILLQRWCPDRCGDWVQSEDDEARLMWIMAENADMHETVCPVSLRIAGDYLQASELVAERALAVWGRCGHAQEYQLLSGLSYESQVLEKARRNALDTMTRNLSNGEVMGLLDAGL